jgi:hypothetical protein
MTTTSGDEGAKKSRKYVGPKRFPVTPGKIREKDLRLSISPVPQKAHLSLPTNETETTLII